VKTKTEKLPKQWWEVHWSYGNSGVGEYAWGSSNGFGHTEDYPEVEVIREDED
jgi:hypothetical protein